MSSPVERLTKALGSRYAIERELGAGGMATVYLAEDLKHDRKVAVKVLKPELAAVLGAERFVAEIKTTASLQHPHILPLHDSGEANGFLYYVMPFIDGETLRDKLNRETQLGVEEAVKIATEVADALEYAHTHGVVHRDIKPENILLQSGRPMIADFGIALAVSAAAGGRMTETGLSLGTPHYMSPEQATAEKDLTARSDIYSLASVLYEMLTGAPPHLGGSAQQIIMKIVTENPAPVTQMRKSVPPNVSAAIIKALEKLPADRFASAAAFGDALSNPHFTVSRPATTRAAASGRGWLRDPRSIGAIAVAAVLGVTSILGRSASIGAPAEYDVGLPDTAGMETGSSDIAFAVSPAGDFVVYETVRQGGSELWYRSLLDATVRRLPGTEGATQPAISPDGNRVAFFRIVEDGWTVEILPIDGGTATTLGRGAGAVRRLLWPTERRLLVLETDGTSVRWYDPESGTSAQAPIAYCIGEAPTDDDDVFLCGGGGRKWGYLRRLGDGSERLLRRASDDTTRVYGSSFRLVDERYLTYTSVAGDLFAAPVDLGSRRVGRAVRLATGLAMVDYTGLAMYDIAASGTLVYAPGTNKAIGHLVRVGDGGVDTLPVGAEAFAVFEYSPDGHRLAAAVEGLEGMELRIYDVSSGRYVTWMRGPFISHPAWSPEGDRIAFGIGDSLFVGSPDRPGSLEFLLYAPEGFEAMAWLPGDRVIAQRYIDATTVALHIDRRPVVIDSLFSGLFARPSPDGRWIAYTDSAFEVAWLEPLPRDGRRFQVAAGNLGEIQWLSSSTVVVSITDGPRSRMERMAVDPTAVPPLRDRRRWVDLPRFRDTVGPSFAIAPGNRVVYLQGASERPTPYLRVTPNWVERMKRMVDEANR